MYTLMAFRVQVTRRFAGGGSVTNEVIVYDASGSVTAVEQKAADICANHTTIPTDLEQRRVTHIEFTYLGQA